MSPSTVVHPAIPNLAMTGRGGGQCKLISPLMIRLKDIKPSLLENRCSEVGWAQVGPPAGVTGIVSKHFTADSYTVRAFFPLPVLYRECVNLSLSLIRRTAGTRSRVPSRARRRNTKLGLMLRRKSSSGGTPPPSGSSSSTEIVRHLSP